MVKLVKWRFYLQPFVGSKISMEGIPVKFRVLKRNNTMALVRVKVPVYRDELGFHFKITHKKFKNFKRDIFLQKQHRKWLRKPVYFVLNRKNSKHIFRHYWKTGSQPKSVRFIDARRIAIPLLNDNGIDIVHILNGDSIRIQPPRKYSRMGGFVESLVLEDEEELWISQMTTNSIHVFNRETLAYKATIPLKGKWVKIMLHDPKRDMVYASNWLSKDISVIDVRKKKEILRFDIKGVPRGLWLNEEGNYLYAAQFGGQTDTDRAGHLVKIDLSSFKIVKKMGNLGFKRHLVYSDESERLYLSDLKNNTIEIYDPSEDILTKKIGVYKNPNTISLDTNQEFMYVSCRGQNSRLGCLYKGDKMGRIQYIDLETNKVLEYWEGGNQTTGLDVSPDGDYIAFSDFLDNAVRVYEKYVLQKSAILHLENEFSFSCPKTQETANLGLKQGVWGQF